MQKKTSQRDEKTIVPFGFALMAQLLPYNGAKKTLMANTLSEGGFDQLDHAILNELQRNGRVSVADLARKIHLSSPAVYQRIKRLERSGVIQQYVALVDREAAGYDLLCFIRVSIQPHTKESMSQFQATVANHPAVLECYHTAGSFDLLMKVVTHNQKELERFVSDDLMTISGVERIETSLVLTEMKRTTALKLK